MKKAVFALTSILILLIALFAIGKKSVHHEIYIPSHPSAVWYVLTDMAKYPEWNPVMIAIDGELQEGSEIKYVFRESDGNEKEYSATVQTLKTDELINQVGGVKGIFGFDHRYELVFEDQGTRLIIHEDYRGIAVPFWNPDKTLLAYQKLSQALQARVFYLGSTG